MSSFKTPKGTELPFLNLKGKDYLMVMHRLVWFREEKPNAQIKTEAITINDNYAIFKATIMDEDGNVLSTAHGREDLKHFPDYIEKSETKSIGRALALCGYGTQFAPELEEGERIVDSPVTKTQATLISRTAVITCPFGSHKGKQFSEIPVEDLISGLGWVRKIQKEGKVSAEFLKWADAGEKFLETRKVG